MEIINNNNFIELNYLNFEFKNKIACFDLDGTIIKTKSGKDFPKDENDWEFIIPIHYFKDLKDKNFCIIIISNQKGISKGKLTKESWIAKLKNIMTNINIPMKVYASIGDDHYRKPYNTFWNIITKNITSVDSNSFYCGDACGRENDHADTDLKFALNCGINFCTPEEFINKVYVSKFSKNHKYNVDFDKIKISKNNYVFNKNDKEMIIMIGKPGSGKSTFARNTLEKLGYFRINMDTLKTKIKCVKECTNKLGSGVNVVIDNTNPDIETRKIYIDLAKKYDYKIRAIELLCDQDVACHASHYRSYISNGDTAHIPTIVYRIYNKKYCKPTKNEGFDEIININFVAPNDADFYKYYY